MDLKTCPFCGSRNVFVHSAFHFQGNFKVECGSCKAVGPLAKKDKAEAIRHWNKDLPVQKREWADVERFIV